MEGILEFILPTDLSEEPTKLLLPGYSRVTYGAVEEGRFSL